MLAAVECGPAIDVGGHDARAFEKHVGRHVEVEPIESEIASLLEGIEFAAGLRRALHETFEVTGEGNAGESRAERGQGGGDPGNDGRPTRQYVQSGRLGSLESDGEPLSSSDWSMPGETARLAVRHPIVRRCERSSNRRAAVNCLLSV